MRGVRHTLVQLQAALIVSAHPYHRRGKGGQYDRHFCHPEWIPTNYDPSRTVNIRIYKHAFANSIPVPSNREELAAAKQPDYIHWAAQHHNSTSSSSSLHRRFALGDTFVLTGTDGADMPTPATFNLHSGLNLTLGEINGLGGDFFATNGLISDGANLTDRVARFETAHALLATDEIRQSTEALALLAIAATERAAFTAAVAAGTDPSAAYNELGDASLDYELATIGRPGDQPGYAGIGVINWDHYGEDARLAYNAALFAALTVAAGGDLLAGYAMNAFADRFLEDGFSAGHMRTPRRLLHDSIEAADFCAQFMHGDDNTIGLNVTSPNGDSWTAYGELSK